MIGEKLAVHDRFRSRVVFSVDGSFFESSQRDSTNDEFGLADVRVTQPRSYQFGLRFNF